ncbi:hypothetical protein KC325_g264 [Hortaea werneckii]|nr:hypothetical protein KC325_g264 [Hortaea werneckii]
MFSSLSTSRSGDLRSDIPSDAIQPMHRFEIPAYHSPPTVDPSSPALPFSLATRLDLSVGETGVIGRRASLILADRPLPPPQTESPPTPSPRPREPNSDPVRPASPPHSPSTDGNTDPATSPTWDLVFEVREPEARGR